MAVKRMRGLSLYGSIDQVWQTAVPGFLFNRKDRLRRSLELRNARLEAGMANR